MKKIILCMTLFIIITISVCPVAAEDLDIPAPFYILIDPKTGQVLYEQSADDRCFPASTTKIMTAVLAIEKGDLDRIVTANDSNIYPGRGGANIGIMAGEEISVRSLLYGLLIRSANETVNIIADNICTTRQEFVDLMNKRAKQLGCSSTHFVTTNGMHDPDHYTTARDMAKIARYAMTFKEFRDIVGQKSFTLPDTNKHTQFGPQKWDSLYTTNRLFYYHSDYYSEVLGIKTGYTTEAGNCLVSAVRNEQGMELLAVIFGNRTKNVDRNVFGSSRTLLEYGFKNFSNQKLIGSNEFLTSVPVEDALDNQELRLITQEELFSVLPVNQDNWNLEKKVQYIHPVFTAPIQKGEVLGTMEYKRNGTLLGKVNIVAAHSVEQSIKSIVTKKVKKVTDTLIFKVIFVTFAVMITFLILRLILRTISRATRSKRQQS